LSFIAPAKISAALAVKWRRGHPARGPATAGWQHGLEQRKAREISAVSLLRTIEDIQRALENAPELNLNLEEGCRREMAYVRDHELPALS